jgi:O-antigen ligase
LMVWLAGIAVVVIPLFFSAGGRDPFRTPKMALFHAGGLLLLAIFATVVVLGRIDFWRLLKGDRLLQFIVAGVLWTAITVIASPLTAISIPSVLTVLSAAMIFIAAYLGASFLGLSIVWLVIVPAMVNSAVLLLQRFSLWSPLGVDDVRLLGEGRFARIALLGNSNDVADLLVIAMVCCVGLLVASPLRWTRTTAMLALLLVTAGLFLTAALTALVAGSLSIAVMSAVGFRNRKRSFLLAGGTVITAAVIVVASMSARAGELTPGKIDSILKGRLIAYSTALAMGADHPLFGVGPGRYGSEFFEYQLIVRARFDLPFQSFSTRISYGEAHNDFLQAFAETGFVGLLLLLALLATLAKMTLRESSGSEPRQRFSRLVGPGGVAAVVILSSAHFPLQLAAIVAGSSFLAGLVAGWAGLD